MAQQSFKVIEADQSHLDEMFGLAKRFWGESNFATAGLTLKPDYWKQTVKEHIGLPWAAGLCVMDEGKMVGYVLVYWQNDFTEERIGEMFQFYVAPEYRGTGAGRLLVAAADAKYTDWGCKRAYCEASPGLANSGTITMFKNLWGKFGFEQIGLTLMKDYNNGR